VRRPGVKTLEGIKRTNHQWRDADVIERPYRIIDDSHQQVGILLSDPNVEHFL
jgi:hypothetical protein